MCHCLPPPPHAWPATQSGVGESSSVPFPSIGQAFCASPSFLCTTRWQLRSGLPVPSLGLGLGSCPPVVSPAVAGRRQGLWSLPLGSVGLALSLARGTRTAKRGTRDRGCGTVSESVRASLQSRSRSRGVGESPSFWTLKPLSKCVLPGRQGGWAAVRGLFLEG